MYNGKTLIYKKKKRMSSSKIRRLIEKTIESRNEQVELDKVLISSIVSKDIIISSIKDLSESTTRLENNLAFLSLANQLMSLNDEQLDKKLIKISEGQVRSQGNENNINSEAEKAISLLHFSVLRY